MDNTTTVTETTKQKKKGKILIIIAACIAALFCILFVTSVISAKNMIAEFTQILVTDEIYDSLYSKYAKSEDENFYVKQIKAADITNENDIFYVKNCLVFYMTNGSDYSDAEEVAKKYNAEIVGYIKDIEFVEMELKGSELSLTELNDTADKVTTESTVEKCCVDIYSANYTSPNDNPYNNILFTDDCDDDFTKNSMSTINIAALDEYSSYAKKAKLAVLDDLIVSYDNNINIKNPNEKYYDYFKTNGIMGQLHGTEVAGTAAGETDKLKGVCPGGNVYSYSEYYMTEALFAAMFTDMFEREQVRVCNYSIGNDTFTKYKLHNNDPETVKYLNDFTEMYTVMFNKFIDDGCDFLLVQAAGNDNNEHFVRDSKSDIGYSLHYNRSNLINIFEKIDFLHLFLMHFTGTVYDSSPFCAITDEKVREHIIVVSANENNTENSAELASYAARSDRVEIVAPVGELGITSISADGYMSNAVGTSFAAPMVTGTVAFMLAVNEDLSIKEVKDILISSSTLNAGDGRYEFPVLNAGNAVKAAAEAAAVDKAA